MWFRTTSTGKVDPTDADVEFTLRHTQYGKCVFKCDNDVVDHQVVNMEFADKSTASFTMSCFNYNGRKSNIMGTKGEMFLDFEGDEIRIFHFEGPLVGRPSTPMAAWTVRLSAVTAAAIPAS